MISLTPYDQHRRHVAARRLMRLLALVYAAALIAGLALAAPAFHAIARR